MISKSLIISALLLAGAAASHNSHAQLVNSTDAGVSVFNYKHANKTALAKTKNSGRLVIPVISVISSQGQPRFSNTNNRDYTPRYQTRTASLVVFVKQEKQKPNINPLLSARHYKTGKHTKRASYQAAELLCQSM
ncbi:hypothetical protein [Dyadobacter bucti]|uniref:hypothetical protein n=1 Tax=Dyadobacter bucti TaxID=2572203 RepID=UPI0011084925|nr:hypothetical protein [Dyadobacter bucti]